MGRAVCGRQASTAAGSWRLTSGTVYEGPYVDGERHGRWVIRYADGTVKERTYVNDERQ